MKHFLPILIFVLTTNLTFSQRGKDGPKTINAANTIVNAYTTLTANAFAGNTTISVANSALNSNFSTSLSAGDLILIIQMQGATLNGTPQPNLWSPDPNDIEGTPNDSTWGQVNQYNNAGNNELVMVESVPNATTINLSCGLKNNYTASGKVQVIRVPRFSTLTINSGASITCPAWNGNTGGVIAIEVLGNTIINSGGSINASALGFRGGVLDAVTDYGGTTEVASNNPTRGAEKGESIGGFQADYDVYGGRYGKGAPANGGGGGQQWTAGGGGGANAGLGTWTGKGNPSLAVANWAQAWNLEYTGFATSTSSGGGRGGYCWSATNQNALTVGPGNSVWGGNNRHNGGGWGGRPLDYSTGRLFLGGGGGAGDQDNNFGGAGGNGGGLIYLVSYGTVSGAGQIISNGANGANAAGTPPTTNYSGKDGAGGGGAGGTILIRSVGNVSGISVQANGGNGGNQLLTPGTFWNPLNPINEAEGPGGGGGGGYVAISNSLITPQVNGGDNGTTNSAALTEFTPNGATRGGAGLITTPFEPIFAISANDTTICGGVAVTLTANVTGTLPSGTVINWYSNPVGGSPVATGITFTTPVLNSTTTYYVGTCPGTYRDTVTITVSSSVNADAGNNVTICPGGSTQLNATGGVSYIWSPATGLSATNISNPIASPTNTTTYYVTVTDANGCSASDSVIVTVGNNLSINLTNDTTICQGASITLNASVSGATSYNWSPSSTLSSSNTSSTVATPLVTTTYYVTVSNGSCSGTDSVTVTINPSAIINAGNNDTICNGQSTSISATASGGGGGPYSFNWSSGQTGAGPHIVSPTSTTTYIVNGTDALGCAAIPDTVIITVNPPLSAALTTNNDTICPGNSVLLTVVANGGDGNYSYAWTGVTSNNQTAVATPSTTTTYSVTVSDGCGSSPITLQQSIVVDTVPIFQVTTNTNQGCEPLSVTFNANNLLNYNIAWNFGDSSNVISGGSNYTYTYSNDGIYTVIIYVTTPQGCTFSDTLNNFITVFNKPDAKFTFSPNNPIKPNETIQFTDQSIGADNWNWTFESGATSQSQNPVYEYSQSGTYNVLLEVSNNFGCIDTFSLEIIIRNELKVPNVFSPNGDGKNDLFIIEGLYGSGNKLEVYNRWGILIYQSEDYKNDWNGDNHPDGTYYFIFKPIDKDEIKGTVNILR
ncbi:MAG: gliding motility-associated C-terminal domain-containing protein [Bacteroidia bacterium]